MTAVTLARRIVPAGPESAGLVEQLWAARTARGAPPRVVLPDGRPAVVARLGAPVRWLDPLTREDDTVGSVVRGPRTVPRVILPSDPAAATWEVGARLTPYALSALHPDGFLVDDHRPLGEALDLDSDALAARLRACWPGDDPDPAGPAVAAARVLEAAVVAAVRRPIPTLRRDELDRVVQLADDERGLVRPVDLARAIDRSLAGLHQLFTEQLGVTPPAFLAAVRLSCAVRELGVDDRGDAARVVAVLRAYADAGYPQREVERFTGMSALELRWAVRGMEELLAG